MLNSIEKINTNSISPAPCRLSSNHLSKHDKIKIKCPRPRPPIAVVIIIIVFSMEGRQKGAEGDDCGSLDPLDLPSMSGQRANCYSVSRRRRVSLSLISSSAQEE